VRPAGLLFQCQRAVRRGLPQSLARGLDPLVELWQLGEGLPSKELTAVERQRPDVGARPAAGLEFRDIDGEPLGVNGESVSFGLPDDRRSETVPEQMECLAERSARLRRG
jgi:hypothetical protein